MKEQVDKKTLWILFRSMLYISAFTFGGGFVIVTFMKKKFVNELQWLEEQEMLDLTAIAQSSPGAIAVNAAISVGLRIAGKLGMLVAVIGTIIPPMLIITVISFFYAAFASNPYVALMLKGMQAGVAAIIIDVAFELFEKIHKERKRINYLVLGASFVATYFFEINVIFIILVAIVIGVIKSMVERKQQEVSL